MEDVPKIVLYSFVSGITVFVGGLLSKLFEDSAKNGYTKEKLLHTSIAFGGGTTIAAVAFVLAPKGMEVLSPAPMTALFLGGATSFFLLDRVIERRGGAIAQLLAMLMDFVPEAMALGAVFATDHELGLLLAIFIGLQNLPESFNSYLDLRKSGFAPTRCLLILFALSFSGIVAALSGFFLLGDMPGVTASLMLVASGGILYLIFQDIAPMSRLSNSWSPALGVNLGFLVGMVGQKMLG